MVYINNIVDKEVFLQHDIECKVCALTILFLIVEAHFNRLWFAIMTFVFKVKVACVVIHLCNENREGALDFWEDLFDHFHQGLAKLNKNKIEM